MNKIIVLQKNDYYSTLTTWIYCHMWMLFTCEQQGDKGYIEWPIGLCLKDLIDKDKFRENENMFEWYFKQPHDDVQDAWAIYVDEYRTWESFADPIPVPLMAQPLSVIKEFYKRNLIFNDVVNERGQALVDKYNIDFKNTLGITWRGTDAKTDGRIRLPIEVYFPFIDDCLKENPNLRIACTAEEEDILNLLLLRYPQAFKIEEFFSSPAGSLQNPERFSPISGFERGLQPVLMVWLFSKCAYYIKNRSSTGAVASWLSRGKIINIAHAETLSYEKLDDQVEIEGKRYPLYR